MFAVVPEPVRKNGSRSKRSIVRDRIENKREFYVETVIKWTYQTRPFCQFSCCNLAPGGI